MGLVINVDHADRPPNESDTLQVFGSNGIAVNGSITLNCRTLRACKHLQDLNNRTSDEASIGGNGTRQSHAEWPVYLDLSPDVEPGTYFLGIRAPNAPAWDRFCFQILPPVPGIDRIRIGADTTDTTLLVTPLQRLNKTVEIFGGPFYEGTQVIAPFLPHGTPIEPEITPEGLRLTLQIDGNQVADVPLGRQQLFLSHRLLDDSTKEEWRSTTAQPVDLESTQAPQITRSPREIHFRGGTRKVAVQGSHFSPEAHLCIRGDTYTSSSLDQSNPVCYEATRTHAPGTSLQELAATIDFGNPDSSFFNAGSNVQNARVWVRNGDQKESSKERLYLHPFQNTARVTLDDPDDLAISGEMMRVRFTRTTEAESFSGLLRGDSLVLRIADTETDVEITSVQSNQVRAKIRIPESARQGEVFELSDPSGRKTWTGEFISVSPAPRFEKSLPTARPGASTVLYFNEGIEGHLDIENSEVTVLESNLIDRKARIHIGRVAAGDSISYTVRSNKGQMLGGGSLSIEAWQEPEDLVSGQKPDMSPYPLNNEDLIKLSPKDKIRLTSSHEDASAITFIIRRPDGSTSEPIRFRNSGEGKTLDIDPSRYQISEGDVFFLDAETPDGNNVMQAYYRKRGGWERLSISPGISAYELAWHKPPAADSVGRQRILNGIQIAAHYLPERFTSRGKSIAGIGLHFIVTESGGTPKARGAASILFLKTLSLGISGPLDPAVFVGANVDVLDFAKLFE